MSPKELNKRIKKAPIIKKHEWITETCKNKSVLDVGCVGQDFTIESPDWLHNKIKKTAKYICGVDINQAGISKMRDNNFDVFHEKELDSITTKFDLIIMGDVIEHVDSPTEFLRRYANFLDDNGQIIISTVNAFSAFNILSLFFFNFYSINSEHTCWFCPKSLAEVSARSNMTIKEFYWHKEEYNLKDLKSYISKIIYIFGKFLIILRKSFSSAFIVTLIKNTNEKTLS